MTMLELKIVTKTKMLAHPQLLFNLRIKIGVQLGLAIDYAGISIWQIGKFRCT